MALPPCTTGTKLLTFIIFSLRYLPEPTRGLIIFAGLCNTSLALN